MGSKKAPSQRQLRVGELVRHALADILMRGAITDPDLEHTVVTVTQVAVTPDLRSATAYVLPLGGSDDDGERLLAALARSRKFVRGQVSRRVALKYMPEITFRLDDSFDRSAAIDRLLHDPLVVRDLDGTRED